MLSPRTSLSCLARTWCINAANCTRGMQEIGLLFALEPGLREIYPEATARSRALQRYTEHTNTHPFFIPLFVGMLLALEEQTAAQLFSEDLLCNFKKATATTLSAVGDAVFSGSLLPMWTMCTILLLIQGLHIWALVLAVLTFCALTAFRIGTFYLGLRQNMYALHWIRRLHLVNWADRLKLCNAVLLALMLYHIAPQAAQGDWLLYGVGIGLMTAAAWGGRRWQLPRLVLAIGAIACLALVGKFL